MSFMSKIRSRNEGNNKAMCLLFKSIVFLYIIVFALFELLFYHFLYSDAMGYSI